MSASRTLIFAALLLPAAAGLALAQQAAAPSGPPPTPMGLTSSSFTDGGIIPDKYTQATTAPVSPLYPIKRWLVPCP